MKIAVSAEGSNLEAQVDPRFGRSAYFVVVDSESGEVEAVPNAGALAGHGAGVQAAQFVVQQGIAVIIAGRIGPNAFEVLDASGIGVYQSQGGTVAETIAAFSAGELSAQNSASGPAHAGMRRGH
jgi:predicted Fe-Mo cluster-binding NifX family protein